jgi:dihydropteroate synthase
MTEPSTAPPLPGEPEPPRPAAPLGSTRIGQREFRWGERTYVMGILNITPDSFSGDGFLAPSGIRRPVTDESGGASPTWLHAVVATAGRMIAEGADLLDVGGESTRPGHESVDAPEERSRVVPAITAIRAAYPDIPLSIDTTKPAVAEAALAAGADLLNDVWAVGPDDGIARVAADHAVPLVVMHNRAEPRYADLVTEVVADLQAALERAIRLGVAPERLIVDPGFGFGKTPEHNLEIVRRLGALRLLGRPILLGTSRKSTLGRILGLRPDDRLEATLATTALGIAAGADLVRVHDVRANVRCARVSDAIVRGGWRSGPLGEGGIT